MYLKNQQYIIDIKTTSWKVKTYVCILIYYTNTTQLIKNDKIIYFKHTYFSYTSLKNYLQHQGFNL